MNKRELELKLIKYLLEEIKQEEYYNSIEHNEDNFKLLRALLNKRYPNLPDKSFIEDQDEYLSLLINEKEIINYKDYNEVKKSIYLIQGDITLINTDAIVNAANNQLLGCFYPNHNCIDNAIHTFSGVQLRIECNDIMKGEKGDTSSCIITNAYNLPSKKIIHTIGPIVSNELNKQHIISLSKCYQNVLNKALENNLTSISICCISTGEYCFPQEIAAKIAIAEVNKFLESNTMDIVFNVFKDEDYEIYKRLLN